MEGTNDERSTSVSEEVSAAVDTSLIDEMLRLSPAERLRHARQTTLRIASTHANAHWAADVLARIAGFLHGLTTSAEQLTPIDRWYRILTHALRHFLQGRVLRPPPRLSAPAI